MSAPDIISNMQRRSSAYVDHHPEPAAYVQSSIRLGGLSVTCTALPAGDLSDPPLSDWVLMELRTAARLSVDHGCGRIEILEPGTFVLTPPSAAVTVAAEKRHGTRVLAIAQERVQKLHLANRTSSWGPLYAKSFRSDWLTGLLDRVSAVEPGCQDELLGDSVLMMIVTECDRLLAPSPKSVGGLAPWQLGRVSDAVEADLGAAHTLASLSGLTGLAPEYFCRAFKRSTGRSPLRWVTERRLEEARRRLAQGDERIGTIAAAVGYDDPSHFARLFRRRYNVGPAEYRRERRS